MARRLVPLLDRVIVEKFAAPAKSTGGVLLPESAVKQISEGVVKAVGPGRADEHGKTMPIGLKEGDKVVLPDYGGTTLNLDGTEYLHLRSSDGTFGGLE